MRVNDVLNKDDGNVIEIHREETHIVIDENLVKNASQKVLFSMYVPNSVNDFRDIKDGTIITLQFQDKSSVNLVVKHDGDKHDFFAFSSNMGLRKGKCYPVIFSRIRTITV